MKENVKIITCKALSPVLEQRSGQGAEVTVLDIALHLQPDRLREALNDKVAGLEEEGTTILLGYGLCGRALEGVCSRKSRLVLPKVDDCVGMLLGSRARHKEILSVNPGSYFMEPRWLETELNIFIQITKGLDHIPQERRKQLLRVALKHYTRLVLLTDGDSSGMERDAAERCQNLAHEYGMEFQRIGQEHRLVDHLIEGRWNEEDFIIAEPGTPIPLF